MVEADEESVTEALLNLLDNAINTVNRINLLQWYPATGSPGVYQVEDHGIGIAVTQAGLILKNSTVYRRTGPAYRR